MDWEGVAGDAARAPDYHDFMRYMLMSWAKAQPGSGLYSRELNDRLKQIAASPFEDLSFEVCGLSFRCDFRFDHFFAESVPASHRTGTSLFGPSDGQTPEFHFRCEIRPAG